jgi:hypothetical protein
MSLYREARSGRRRLWISLVVGAVALAVLVVALVLLTGGEQSEAQRLAELQDEAEPALAALELVPIHYESPNPTTHAAAADQLAVARETVNELEDDLRARDAAATEMLLRDLDELAELVRTRGRLAAVERETAAAAADLRALVGLARTAG